MDTREFFERHGFVVVRDLINADEVAWYRQLYEDFLSGKIEVGGNRSDLSGTTDGKGAEKITQIMRPAIFVPELLDMPLHQRALAWARQLLGDDMDLDFDMLIDKAPHTGAITPWHQDEAYWLNLPDKRAVSCWVALDDAGVDNGCMWFVPGSHREALRPHHQTGKGGALECAGNESEGVPAEFPAGSCSFHHGRTVHYSRGNCSDRRRRAFIVNFRPAAMIALEREQGYDHLGDRTVRNVEAR